MKPSDLTRGQIVRVSHLSQGTRILADQECLDARREGVMGQVVTVNFEDTDEQVLVWVQHGGSWSPIAVTNLSW